MEQPLYNTEIQKYISNYIKSITDTFIELNKKDTLTADEIKKINDKLTTELKNVETKMTEFNKIFIDTEELQSEVTKLKNSIINSINNKDTAEAAVVKPDITNVKTSNEDIGNKIKEINIKIADLYAKAKEIHDRGDRAATINTNFNNANTRLTAKDEELKREITRIENLLNYSITTEIMPLINNLVGVVNDKMIETNTKITSVKTLLDNIDTKFTTKDEQIIRKIENVESTSLNTIQITNAANKTLIDEINKKINDLSIKVPFQFKVASIIATDQIEIFGTTIKSEIYGDNTYKTIYYDILSRVTHNDKFRSFRALGVRSGYFEKEDENILILKTGLKFLKSGTYIIESNFKITMKKGFELKRLYLNYIHNKTSYLQYDRKSPDITYFCRNEADYIECELSFLIRFDIKSNDTLDIKLCVDGIKNYDDIFRSFTNSSIEIYYIDYLGLPIS